MRNKKGIGHELSGTIIWKFFVTLLIYIVAVILLMGVVEFILRQFVWQRGDTLYKLFKLIDGNTFEFIVICGLAGFIFIFVFYWRKTLSFIDSIVEASQTLLEREEDIIQLPAELKQLEIRMNKAKQEVDRSARLAKESEQRKNDLVMYLAHDIKTPLTSVVGYLSLLDEASDMTTEQRTKYVRVTLDKAYRLEQLINEFFEITRYNLQTITLSKESIDLYYMLAQMVEEFYPQLAANAKRAEIHVPEELTIYGDPDKLARVFNNILKNAIAYSPDNSVINIEAAAAGDKMSVMFTNDGSIPEDKLTSIFDKFYRLDYARSSGTGGAGLGLAIAKEIVLSHGGDIKAESGNGRTVFIIELPLESA